MRDIKNGSFGWYEKGAMEKIETLPWRKQASCKLIYIAICSGSAKRKNSQEIECYRFEIAKFASVDEKTVYRHLPALEDLGIIKVFPQDRLSSGKYSKVKIVLNQANPAVGHFEDSSETRRGLGEDSARTISPIYINKEIKEEIKEKKERESPLEFFENLEKQEKLIIYLSEEKGILPDVARAEVTKFISYWTEKNTSGTKERWQMEKVFEVKRRLGTWFSKVRDFSPQTRGGISFG